MMNAEQPIERALSVAEFVRTLNVALETVAFPYGALVEGEVSQYRVSQGKWVWFDLKDPEGVVNCFATVWQLKTPLEDGMKVRVHGTPSVFAKSGKFSLKVDRVEPVGEGALKRAYDLLKKKLAAEGLFDAARKRELPRFPERLGLIASTESAAYTDFLRILGNRFGGVRINSLHVQVQGRDAISDIVNAFRYFNAHPELAEVLVLTRGGGSLEDLQAFNSEEVARAVFSSKIPVICAVGHERDESLADYAADIRASTPSNAAELVVPDRRDLEREVDSMVDSVTGTFETAIRSHERRLYEFETRLTEHVRSAREDFEAVMADLARAVSGFERKLQERAGRAELLAGTLTARYERRVAELASAVEQGGRLLGTLDPQAVLKRGYAIVRDKAGRVVRSATAIDKGDKVNIQLHKGAFEAEKL
jgi:exodeoxyribonuclease VII large subunit